MDLIERQAAIDAAIEAADEWDGGYSLTRAEMIENKLKDLPSAQPKPCEDVVSRQAAIDAIDKALSRTFAEPCGEMILKDVPSAQPETCGDAVSRKAAVEEIRRHGVGSFDFEDYTPEQAERFVIKLLQNLPSVQPEREQAIKDCRNCKNGRYNDHYGIRFCYEVTSEALDSVAQYLLTNHKELRFTYKDVKYVLKVEEAEGGEEL